MIAIRLCTCATLLLVAPGSPPMLAATLEARTIAAFDRYVAESDRQSTPSLSEPAKFLWVDGQSRAADLAALRRGQLVISRLETKANAKEIEIPGGLVHHW